MRNLIYTIFLICVISSCSGLKHTQGSITPQDTIHSVREAKNGLIRDVSMDVIRDTIIFRDSIYVLQNESLKVVEKWHTQYIYKDRLKTDTNIVYFDRFLTDTIKIPYAVDRVIVKNELNLFQMIFFWVGIITFLGIIAYILLKIKK